MMMPGRFCKVSAPMTERNPQTAQPPHEINYENSQRNFGYVGRPLVKCDTAFKFAQCVVKGSCTKLLRSTCVCLDSICDSFHKPRYLLLSFFCRRIPTSQLTILQNLKQFKLVNLYLQGFEDWSCGHWPTYLRCPEFPELRESPGFGDPKVSLDDLHVEIHWCRLHACNSSDFMWSPSRCQRCRRCGFI